MQEVLLPQFGMGMTNGTVVGWRVQVGDQVRAGDILFEVEAAKTTVEVPSPADGRIAEIRAADGQMVDVRAVVAVIDDGAGAPAAAAPAPAPVTAAPTTGLSAARRTNSLRQVEPRARRLAMDKGLDLEAIRGTGPNGRVREEDVQAALQPPAAPAVAIAGFQAESRHDLAALQDLVGKIAAAAPDADVDIASLLARMLSLSAARSLAPQGSVVVVVREGGAERIFADAHLRPASRAAESADTGAPPFARLLLLQDSPVRRVTPRASGAALDIALVIRDGGDARAVFVFSPVVDDTAALTFIAAFDRLAASPIAALVV